MGVGGRREECWQLLVVGGKSIDDCWWQDTVWWLLEAGEKSIDSHWQQERRDIDSHWWCEGRVLMVVGGRMMVWWSLEAGEEIIDSCWQQERTVLVMERRALMVVDNSEHERLQKLSRRARRFLVAVLWFLLRLSVGIHFCELVFI